MLRRLSCFALALAFAASSVFSSAMFWVVVRVLRSLFPEKFKPGRKREKDEV